MSNIFCLDYKTSDLRDFYCSTKYFIYGTYKSPANVKKTALQ